MEPGRPSAVCGLNKQYIKVIAHLIVLFPGRRSPNCVRFKGLKIHSQNVCNMLKQHNKALFVRAEDLSTYNVKDAVINIMQ